MDQDVRKSNKIPGSEQLTRPEEIAALSRYLGEIKKVQEEHTKLGEDNLEVPGRTTGRIPKINSLEDLVLSPTNGIDEDIKLPETIIGIEKPNNEIELETEILAPEKPKEVGKLEDEVKIIEENRKEEIKLPDILINLQDKQEPRLETQSIKIEDRRNQVLENTRKDLNPDLPETRLENKSEKLFDPRETKLDEKIIEFSGDTDKIKSLSDFIESLGNEKPDPKLSDYIEDLNVENENRLGDTRIDIEDPRDTNLKDRVKKLIGENKNPELRDIIEKILGNIDDVNLSNVRVDILKEVIKEASKKLDDDGLYKLTIKLLEQDGSDWALKVASMVSAYLSGNYISIPRAKEYEESLSRSYIFPEILRENKLQLEDKEDNLEENIKKLEVIDNPSLEDKTDKVPENKNEVEAELEDSIITSDLYRRADGSRTPGEAPFQNLSGLSVRTPQHNTGSSIIDAGMKFLNSGANAFLRDTAEMMVGPIHGSIRTQLLNETLALLILGREKLEDKLGMNKSRLPGDSTTSFLNQATMTGLSNAIGGFDLASGFSTVKNIIDNKIYGKVSDNPFNRPSKDLVTEEINSYYTQPYISLSEGFKTTLRGLCGKENIEPSSIEELKSILEDNTSLITTASKINKGNILTLDMNSYWEVLIERHIDNDFNSPTFNGGITYLPSIKEINILNKKIFNADTYYGPWVPITSFDLEKSKLTTKSLGLFDGEIIYPISMELTNDLRLNIADDIYKSWRHYFQKCADVAVYDSQPWAGDYETYEGGDYAKEPVANVTTHTENDTILDIDKNTSIVAFYKNIAFKVTIYIMTPQLETIKKFCLLCVLKDFSETYSGEAESGGGSDLNITLSIVGEFDDTVEDRTENNIEETRKREGYIANVYRRGYNETGTQIRWRAEGNGVSVKEELLNQIEAIEAKTKSPIIGLR